MKNKFQRFCENKELNKIRIIIKIILLFIFSVFFLYLLIGMIKFYNTDGYNILKENTLTLFIIWTLIFFILTIFITYSTLKNKDETEKIADFFEDIIFPFTALGAILIGVENLDSIVSLKGFITDGDAIEAFDDLLIGTYLIITPLVWSVFYNVKVWWNKIQ